MGKPGGRLPLAITFSKDNRTLSLSKYLISDVPTLVAPTATLIPPLFSFSRSTSSARFLAAVRDHRCWFDATVHRHSLGGVDTSRDCPKPTGTFPVHRKPMWRGIVGMPTERRAASALP